MNATVRLGVSLETRSPGPTGQVASAPAVTVVIPTRNEAGNVEPLMDRLRTALPEFDLEVIFVDDSDDRTDQVVARLKPTPRCPIRLIHRPPEERTGGLGGAVVVGMRAARAGWICVMDADLQHPPEVLADLVQRAARGDVDVVVASRFCEDGRADDFGPLRRTVSELSTAVAHRLFARELGGLTDPMSGFFLVRRGALKLDALRPQGFKILLEILVRSGTLRTAEVPFVFGVRHSGKSKASATEGARYLGQLWRLRFKDLADRFGRFGVVGLTGLVVNTLLLACFVDVLGIWYLLGAVLATQGSTLWNFVLTDRWVFRRGESRLSFAARLLAFFAMNNLALLLRIPALFVLVSVLGFHHLLSNAVTLLALSLIRFGLADCFIWERRDMTGHAFNYDVHGLVTIVSDGLLPELERFRVDGVISDPTIRVRLDHVRSKGVGATTLPDGRTRVHYAERFGTFGFAAEIDLGARVDIVAAPLLRRSPHVLYTNIVEPVLRWTFVERGYALVHAACLAADEHAFLITARTDTGKTTTALKTLDKLPFAFLSDDLTLISPGGRVLAYPKPLTISRHTLSAVETPLLRRRERMGLIVQSRLHSRSGRLFGLIVARTRMPAATLNALVQLVVPPPKFQIDRLVPHVIMVPEAQLAGLAVIERDGGDCLQPLSGDEALDIVLRNCEDAYGFPPYPAIQRWLHTRDGRDLKAIEREIIRRALFEKPAHLLRSRHRDWDSMLPALVTKTVGATNGNLDHGGVNAASSTA
jgi:dolichol-phosphate mannosyltransferase